MYEPGSEHRHPGVARGRTQRDQRLAQRGAVVIDGPDAMALEDAGHHAGSSGCGSRRRRTRRSDFAHCPRAPDRRRHRRGTRSMPDTTQRAPWGVAIPIASRTNPSDDSTTSRGTTPSRTAACSPAYRSSRNRLSVRTRWARPASTWLHSSAGIRRGNQVERKGPLDALLVAVDREGDALGAEGRVAHLVASGELVGAEPLEKLDQYVVVGTGGCGLAEHLVVGAVGVVGTEQVGHRFSVPHRWARPDRTERPGRTAG